MLEELVSREIGVDGVNEAFTAMQSGEVARSAYHPHALTHTHCRRERPGPQRPGLLRDRRTPSLPAAALAGPRRRVGAEATAAGLHRQQADAQPAGRDGPERLGRAPSCHRRGLLAGSHSRGVPPRGVGLLLTPRPTLMTVTVRPHAARLPAARRRQQLLDVALRVFGEQGFHPASMNDVAEAAGVTKPVLYQHFRSKRDLYREVLTDVGAQLLDAITKATTAAAGRRTSRSSSGSSPTSVRRRQRGRLPSALRWRHPPRRGVRGAGGQGRGRHRRGHRHPHRRRGARRGRSGASSPTASSAWPRAPAASGWPRAPSSRPRTWPASSPTWPGAASAASEAPEAMRRTNCV